MPTNEERRATAKRKLNEQLDRRAKQARQRRILAIAAAVGAAVIAIAAGTTTVLRMDRSSHEETTATAETPDASGAMQLPKFAPSDKVGANCEYPTSAQPASKPVEKPRSGKVPNEPAQVSVSMVTDQGNIGLLLANDRSPCTVNSFVSLTTKKFFDDTECHRLTTSKELSVLQCGDPSADGTGGPGYQFANEYPTDQYPPDDPARQEPAVYPRGTLAMANSGPDTNGSQFFLVYQDSLLPPQYTVFGKIQDDGLATLDKIAAAGVQGGSEDGPPATKVVVKSVRMD